MTEDVTTTDGPFDLEKLRELVELMEKHGLTEVSLKRGEEKWRLRRGPQEVVTMVPAAAPLAANQPAASAPAAPAPSGDSAAEPVDDGSIMITSPTVGTFYSAPTPDDPPYVKTGSKVDSDTIVCIVEAMKVFNQIPAEVSGTIAEVLVENGDPIDFGQPLFRVRP